MSRLRQQQSPPGTTSETDPGPDHGGKARRGPGRPAETVPVYALLAPDGAGRVSGARVGATGGQPVL
ncbi:hypothetical protein [Streptomyces cinereoruber]|uniref:hypothetical protein n=1 Tax=Streptomyces cinereoruber TaxID=67260 RepID=UPI00362F0EBC